MPYQWQGIGTSATSGVSGGRVPNSQLGFTEPEDERFGFKTIGRGLLRGFEEIDKPLAERAGFILPEAAGPFDEIGNFLLREGTRPTNLLFALPGVGASHVLGKGALHGAKTLGASSGLRALPKIGSKLPAAFEGLGAGTVRGLSRAGRAVVEPIGGYTSSLPARIAAETGVTMAASGAGRAAEALLPDNVTGYARVGALIAGGLIGGVSGAAGIARGMKAAGLRPSLDSVMTMDNMIKAAGKTKTPQGRQAMFATLQADNLLKKQFANRGESLTKRRDALMELSGLFEESGLPAVSGGKAGYRNQIEWMEKLLERNNKRLNKQGYASGMSLEDKIRYYEGQAGYLGEGKYAAPLADISGGQRTQLAQQGGSRARRLVEGEPEFSPELMMQKELREEARVGLETFDQFHEWDWYKYDALQIEERNALGKEMASVLSAKDAIQANAAVANYIESKDLRGGRQFMGDVDGLDELVNFGLGEDENLLRLVELDDALYQAHQFHGTSGKEIAARQASNPVFNFLHSAGVTTLNPWGALVGAKNAAMVERGNSWVNGQLSFLKEQYRNADIEGIFNVKNDGKTRATGRLIKKDQLELTTNANGDTGFDLTQNAVEQGRITQEQKDFFSEIIRFAALRYQMLKRAGISDAKLADRGGLHVRDGRRVSEVELNKATGEIELKKEMDDFFESVPSGYEEVEFSPLAQELEELGLPAGRQAPSINTKNPLIGDVLELGIYDADLEELLATTGGAYFHRELYNDPTQFRLKNQRSQRSPSDIGTQNRRATVDAWVTRNEVAATMEETLQIVPDLQYEGNFLKVMEAELHAFMDLLTDAQLERDIATKGKTAAQLMLENVPDLVVRRNAVKSALSRTKLQQQQSDLRREERASMAKTHEAEAAVLKEQLGEIYRKFLQLNELDTPSSRGAATRGTPVEFEGEQTFMPTRTGDDLDAPVFPDAEGNYPTRPDIQGQPELERRGTYDVQDRTFRAQIKLDALNLNNLARDMSRQIVDTMNLIDSIQTSFVGTRAEYREVSRRLGGLRSALKKAQDGVKAKKEFTTARGRRVEVGDSLQRNISDLDDQILDLLGEGWAIRQVDANEIGLGRMPTGEIRRVYDRPLYGDSQAWAFHHNDQPIALEQVLENLADYSVDRNGVSRLRGRFASKAQLDERKQSYNELFKSYVRQTEKVNGILNTIEDVEVVYRKLVEDVANNVDQTNELNAAVTGVVADYSTEAGQQMSFMLNNFDRAILEGRIRMLRNQYDRNSVLGQTQARISGRHAKQVENAEANIKTLQRDNEGLNLQYQRELDRIVEGSLLNKVNGLSSRLNGDRYFSADAAAELQMQLLPEQMDGRFATQVWRATNAFNNTMRPVMAAFDMSAIGIQGLLALGTNPTAAMEAFFIASRSLVGDHSAWNNMIVSNYPRAAKGDLSIQAAIADGMHWSAEDSIGEFGIDIGRTSDNVLLNNKVSQSLGISKLADMSNMHFSRTGNLLRYMMYQNAYEANTWSKNLVGLVRGEERVDTLQGLSEKDRKELIQTINEATGWKAGKPKELESTLLFAPRFFKSQINILSKAVRGKTAANQYAGDLLLRTVAMGSFFTIAMNEARGNHTDLNPIKTSINGDTYYNTNFMRIQNVGGADISVFGPWDTMVSMLTMAFTEGPLGLTKRTLEYKASPASSLVTDIFRGRTFEGGEVFRSANPITAITDVLEEGKGSLPFTAQDITAPMPIIGDDGTPWTIQPILNAFGVKSNPTTATERRDLATAEWVLALTDEERAEVGFEVDKEYSAYRDLTGKARVAFNAEQPEHEENMRENRGRFAAQGDKPALASLEKGDIRADRIDSIERLVEHYQSGAEPVMTMSQLLDLISEENKLAAERRAQVDKIYETAITNPDLSDPNDVALNQFYALYSDPQVEVAPNLMDWNTYDMKYTALHDSWTPEQRRYVDARQPTQYPEEIQPYVDAKGYIARSGYYNVGAEIYQARRRNIQDILTRANLPVPESWSSFDALWTDLKRTNPVLARQLSPFHKEMAGTIGELKNRFIAQDKTLSEALVLTGRRTNPVYSMLAGN